MASKIVTIQSDNKPMLKRMDPEDSDEVMTGKDAAMFPFYGSAVLFSLYLLCKHFNQELVSTLLSFYFALLGQLCLM